MLGSLAMRTRIVSPAWSRLSGAYLSNIRSTPIVSRYYHPGPEVTRVWMLWKDVLLFGGCYTYRIRGFSLAPAEQEVLYIQSSQAYETEQPRRVHVRQDPPVLAGFLCALPTSPQYPRLVYSEPPDITAI